MWVLCTQRAARLVSGVRGGRRQSTAVQFAIDCGGHALRIDAADEPGDTGGTRPWVGNCVVVVHEQRLEAGRRASNAWTLRRCASYSVVNAAAGTTSVGSPARASIAFCDATTSVERPLHEDHAIVVGLGQILQQRRDDLHRRGRARSPASRSVGRRLVEVLHRFELEIARAGSTRRLSRTPSVTSGRPPAASICIIIDVPERGRPETTTIGGRSGSRRHSVRTTWSCYSTAARLAPKPTVRITCRLHVGFADACASSGASCSSRSSAAAAWLTLCSVRPTAASAYIGPGAGFALRLVVPRAADDDGAGAGGVRALAVPAAVAGCCAADARAAADPPPDRRRLRRPGAVADRSHGSRTGSCRTSRRWPQRGCYHRSATTTIRRSRRWRGRRSHRHESRAGTASSTSSIAIRAPICRCISSTRIDKAPTRR